MSSKKLRREAAQKKARRKKITIMAICAVLAVTFIVGIIIYQITRPGTRVFAVANQSITLYENGRFTARLAHNDNFSGTFTEEVDGEVTTISFTRAGSTVSTQITNDVLLLPPQWRTACGHGHETEFPLRR